MSSFHQPQQRLQRAYGIMEDEGKLFWSYDAGWDEIETEKKYYDMLRTKLVDKGYLMSWDGRSYVFIKGERRWVLLASNTGAKNICMLLGMENYTTGYVNAMSRYHNWLTKHCHRRPCSIMPRSICIGTRRLEISVEGKTMGFKDCDSLLGDFKFEDPRACQAAINPVSFVNLPVRWVHPGAGNIESFIYPLFDNDTDMETLKWHIGNSLIDPAGSPKALIMFGPGGTGKSTILSIIIECMEGCCGVLPHGTFTSTAIKLTDDVKAVLAGSRMAICDSVDLDNRPTNVNAVKGIAEGDYISDDMNTFKPNCSLTLASTGLPDPSVSSNTLSDAFLRHTVVLNLKTAASFLAKDDSSYTQVQKIDFICACVYTRMTHTYIPMSPSSMLLTLCQLQYLAVRELVEEHPAPTISDYQDILAIIHVHTFLSTNQIVHKAMLISRSSVIEVAGSNYLKGLRPRR